MPSPMPLVEPVTTAALPFNIGELPYAVWHGARCAPVVLGEVVEGDLPQAEGEVAIRCCPT